MENERLILAGVDEAGRGSVIGPLVVAGVAIEESKIPLLKEIGVRDSKLLAARRRKQLYNQIKKLATAVVWEKVQPIEIDNAVLSGRKFFRLNYLEARYMASVLARLKYDEAFVDCCDTNEKRFGVQIAELEALERGLEFGLGEENSLIKHIRCEHHADRNYPVVSAASIIAKVTRDSQIERLRKKHGLIGSGYPSDPDTISYLNKSKVPAGEFPPFVRKSWLTVRRIQSEIRASEVGSRPFKF